MRIFEYLYSWHNRHLFCHVMRSRRAAYVKNVPSGTLLTYEGREENRLADGKKIRKKRVSASMREKLADALDVPLESMIVQSSVSITGTREAAVHGCSGVLEYGAERVVLRVSEGQITIRGTFLEMQSLIDDRITVRGCIEAVCFGEEEGER